MRGFAPELENQMDVWIPGITVGSKRAWSRKIPDPEAAVEKEDPPWIASLIGDSPVSDVHWVWPLRIQP